MIRWILKIPQSKTLFVLFLCFLYIMYKYNAFLFFEWVTVFFIFIHYVLFVRRIPEDYKSAKFEICEEEYTCEEVVDECEHVTNKPYRVSGRHFSNHNDRPIKIRR
ncbi:hypothetical protein BC355_17590 [Vibrio cholerae]|uniref:Uncharacterized protein n=1 Tax=Vibrio cholerae TaxID=666 RepID=A0A395TG53_VIBCL|nr:hypothetical protein BC355_17590 [Vibrio cholerae]RGP83312.1 hypothetical protein BC353_17550 [Vibrio cholerae]